MSFWDIRRYESLSSTNLKLLSLIYDDAPEGVVVTCDNQTAGRGRRENLWIPVPGALYMSVLLKPDVFPHKIPGITLMTGLAVCLALREEYNADVLIKWPNDLVINNKKVCGILAEMSTLSEETALAVGIGVNLNTKTMPEEIKKTATSLFIETGIEKDKDEIMLKILSKIEYFYKEFFLKCKFKDILSEYKKLCDTLEREVFVKAKNPFKAKAVDINNDGGLIVIKKDGETVTVYSGEVSIGGYGG